jgi:hypothetical protein
MPVTARWIGGAPEDLEQWEDLLSAEYGTALGLVELTFEKVGDGWRLATARETAPGAGSSPRLDQRGRFIQALRAGGKPVLGDLAEVEGELEPVGVDALSIRTDKARREGGSGE